MAAAGIPRRFLLLAWGTLLHLLSPLCLPAVEAPPEFRVKAAFLLSFAAFVEWPSQSFPSSASPILIGIHGSDPFGAVLEQVLEGERVHGRAFRVIRAAPGEPAPACHLLFICDSEAERVADILEELRGTPTLTVSSLRRFVDRGGMIQFVTQRGRIRFRVNGEEARAANLAVSSRLLRLAEP